MRILFTSFAVMVLLVQSELTAAPTKIGGLLCSMVKIERLKATVTRNGGRARHNSRREHGQQIRLFDDGEDISRFLTCGLSSRGRPRATLAFLAFAITVATPNTGLTLKGCKLRLTPIPASTPAGCTKSGGREWVAMPTAESEKALKPGQWNELKCRSRASTSLLV